MRVEDKLINAIESYYERRRQVDTYERHLASARDAKHKAEGVLVSAIKATGRKKLHYGGKMIHLGQNDDLIICTSSDLFLDSRQGGQDACNNQEGT